MGRDEAGLVPVGVVGGECEELGLLVEGEELGPEGVVLVAGVVGEDVEVPVEEVGVVLGMQDEGVTRLRE